MDKIFSSLGIFELWGILFPGAINSIFLYGAINYYVLNKLDLKPLSDNIAILIPVFYLVGLILHSMSQYLNQFIYRPSGETDPFRSLLMSRTKYISEKQKKIYLSMIREIIKYPLDSNSGNDNSFISGYLLGYLEIKNLDKKTQSIHISQNLSRNMLSGSLVILLLFVLYALIYAFKKNFFYLDKLLFIVVICLIQTFVFYYRTKKYHLLNVKTIYLTFYINYNSEQNKQVVKLTQQS